MQEVVAFALLSHSAEAHIRLGLYGSGRSHGL